MRQHQPAVLPAGFADAVDEGHVADPIGELGITPARDRQHVLDRLTARAGQAFHGRQVVQTEQAAIGDQDHALEPIAFDRGLDHRQQGAHLADVAGVHLVRDRQALAGLDHTEYELACDAAGLLAHPVGAHIVGDPACAADAHGGQVVEHHRHLVVEQRPQLRGDRVLDRAGAIHQRIHRAQQVVVAGMLRVTRQSDGIEPSQHAELGIGLAQAVEDHGANHGERIEAAIGRPQRPRHSTLQTQLLPERVQGVNIAERLGADELDVGNRRGYPTESPLQTAD